MLVELGPGVLARMGAFLQLLLLPVFFVLFFLFLMPQIAFSSRSKVWTTSEEPYLELSLEKSKVFNFKEALRVDRWRMEAIQFRLQQQQKLATSFAMGFPLRSAFLEGTGAYYTTMVVGTPGKKVNMLVDTGSDISWLPCGTSSVFDFSASSSYQPVLCGSDLCTGLKQNLVCRDPSQSCSYTVTYLDQSSSQGLLALERFGDGNTVLGKKVAFGCSSSTKGNLRKAVGLLGLGQGSLSFMSQVAPVLGNQFSYCLGPLRSSDSTKLLLGDGSIQGAGYSFTPLLEQPLGLTTYYFVKMTGIEVNGKLVDLSTVNTSERFEGTIVDSGTTLTYLALREEYRAFKEAFLSGLKLTPVDSPLRVLDTCFSLRGRDENSIPKVTLHFEGDVSLNLPEDNVVIKVNDDISCLAFAPSIASGVAILGSFQQQRISVGFDLDRRVVAFSSFGKC